MLHPVSRFIGSAGQSFGCFLTPGMNIRLVGEANDYVGKVWTILMCAFIQPNKLTLPKCRFLGYGWWGAGGNAC